MPGEAALLVEKTSFCWTKKDGVSLKDVSLKVLRSHIANHLLRPFAASSAVKATSPIQVRKLSNVLCCHVAVSSDACVYLLLTGVRGRCFRCYMVSCLP